MPVSITSSVRGALCALLLVVSTVVLSLALLAPALLKRALPLPPLARSCDRLLIGLAGAWVALNKRWMDAGGRTKVTADLANLFQRGLSAQIFLESDIDKFST